MPTIVATASGSLYHIEADFGLFAITRTASQVRDGLSELWEDGTTMIFDEIVVDDRGAMRLRGGPFGGTIRTSPVRHAFGPLEDVLSPA